MGEVGVTIRCHGRGLVAACVLLSAVFGIFAAPSLAQAACGPAWNTVSSPNPNSSGNDRLHALTVLSPSNAWAVGTTGSSSTQRALALHWNGTSWTQVATPN